MQLEHPMPDKEKSKTERILLLLFQNWKRTIGSLSALGAGWVKLLYPDLISNEALGIFLFALYIGDFVTKNPKQNGAE